MLLCLSSAHPLSMEFVCTSPKVHWISGEVGNVRREGESAHSAIGDRIGDLRKDRGSRLGAVQEDTQEFRQHLLGEKS